MSFASVNCVILICDGCDEQYEEEYVVHYADDEGGRSEAREHAADYSNWEVVAGEDYCPDCSPPRGECGACGMDLRKLDGNWHHYDGGDPASAARRDVEHTPYDVDDEPPAAPLPPPAGEQQEIPT